MSCTHVLSALHRLLPCQQALLLGMVLSLKHKISDQPRFLYHERRSLTLGLQNLVCVSVCLSVSILALQATTQLMRDTNSCSTTSARKLNKRFCYNYGVRDRVTGIVKDHVARPSPSISGVSMRVLKYQRPCCCDTTLRIYLWPPLACLWPLAAQRNGEKRMCSPVYLLMLPVCEKLALLTGIHRVCPCPIE